MVYPLNIFKRGVCMPLPFLIPLAAKVLAPIAIAGAGKLYHGHKKEKFESNPDNAGKEYSLSQFASVAVTDLKHVGEKATEKATEKARKDYNSAYSNSKRYSTDDLRDKYNESSGAEKAGYGNALKERLQDD